MNKRPDFSEEVVEEVEEVIESIDEVVQVDIPERDLDVVVDKLDVISHQLTDLHSFLSTPSVTDYIINIYGLIVIPAGIILFALWHLIAPFALPYRD